MSERVNDRADLEDALAIWAGNDPIRKRIEAALSLVLVDYEVMLPRVKDRKEYRRWVAESVGDLGDALMAAWDDRHKETP
jgi:hypothetical protein